MNPDNAIISGNINFRCEILEEKKHVEFSPGIQYDQNQQISQKKKSTNTLVRVFVC